MNRDNDVTIHLYHTNDLHSHFEHWTRISNFVKGEKERHEQQGDPVFVLDIGDHVDRFHMITEATSGQGNIQLLNAAKYDYATIGNNEGITLSKEQLHQLYDHASFQVLLANLFEQNGDRPHWAKPYDMQTLPNGMTIAFIGLTVQYELFYSQLGWKIADPISMLEQVLAEVKMRADIVVLLSHLGRDADEYIAQNYDIDVILGAHTHHFFESGLFVNGTLLCCTGKWGRYVGHVTLQIDGRSRQMKLKARTIATKLLGSYEGEDHMLQTLQRESEAIMEEPIVELKEDLLVDWYKETQLMKLLAETLREWCSAEVSMINAGVLLESLQKGNVTRGDIHRICPHPINPCRLMVKGKTLREIIIKARRPQTEKLEIKGLGFRGKVMGKMIYAGIDVTPDTIPGNKLLLEEVLINGEELDPERTYAVATLDMFTFGYLYPELAIVLDKRYYMPELLRDVLKETLLKHASSVKS